MLFEGVRGSSWQGDIAIDDFSLRPGSCSGLPPTPPPPQTPAPPPGGLVDVSVLIAHSCELNNQRKPDSLQHPLYELFVGVIHLLTSNPV